MNGKILLLLMLSLNIVAAAFAFSCATNDVQCGENFSNAVINFFFDIGADTDLTDSSGFNINENAESAIADMTQQESGGGIITGLFETVTSLLDALKMVIGFIALLTPLPFLTMLYSLGLPFIFTMIIGIPTFALYAISIMELIRGGNFGS